MTVAALHVVSAQDAAHALRHNLGPARAWNDFLSDCIQERTDFHGLVLLPTAASLYRGSPRPLYAVADIYAFVRQAHARMRSITAARRLDVSLIMVDLADGRHWRERVVPTAPYSR